MRRDESGGPSGNGIAIGSGSVTTAYSNPHRGVGHLSITEHFISRVGGRYRH